jgi:hypothetical protein
MPTQARKFARGEGLSCHRIPHAIAKHGLDSKEWAIDVTKSDERSSRRFNVYMP